MKKIIAVICVMAMLLSFSIEAFASDLDFLNKKYSSYDGEMEFYVELNKPLEFMSLLNEEADFDVKYFTENLLKTKIKAKVQAEISEDMKSAKVYLALNPNVPIHISEDLKFDADVTGHMWVEYDFSDVENAKYIVVFKNPLNGEYLYIDFLNELLGKEGLDPEIVAKEFEKSMNSETLKYSNELIEVLKKSYENNANITKDGEWTKITFTNNALVDFIFEITEGFIASEYMNVMLGENNLTRAELNETLGTVDLPTIKALVKGLGIFGESDALTESYKLDKNGYIIESEEKLRLDFNIYETAQALGADETDIIPFTKENSDIDITFCTKTTYNKINEKNIVTMPLLTEENSKNIIEMVGGMAGDSYEDDFYYDEESFVEYEEEKFWDYATGKMERNGMYVDMEEFLDSAQWDSDELSGEVSLVDKAVVMTLNSNTLGDVSIVGSVNKDEFVVNGLAGYVRKPFIVVDEYNWDTYEADKKVYVSVEVLEHLFGCKVQSMTVYLMDENGLELTEPEYHIELVRPNLGYTEPAEIEISEKAQNLGIIGGADGPTMVFVTE